MFFTPAGEELWVPGWQPRYLHLADGATRAGMAFTTGEGDEFTLWTLAMFEPRAHRSIYARTTPALRMGLVGIECAPAAGGTDVTVSYDMTALNERGEQSLSAYQGDAYVQMIDGWAQSIAQRLPELLAARIR